MTTYTLTTGNDAVTGTVAADVLDGAVVGQTGGVDALRGGANNDQLFLGAGGQGFFDGGTETDTVFATGDDLGSMNFINVEVLSGDSVTGTFGQFNAFGTITDSNSLAQIAIGLRGAGGTLDFTTKILGFQSVHVTATGVTSATTLPAAPMPT